MELAKQRQKSVVFKGFFLATLGFTPTNAEPVAAAVRVGEVCSELGTSGGHSPGNKVDVDAIKSHIQKFHPIKHHIGLL